MRRISDRRELHGAHVQIANMRTKQRIFARRVITTLVALCAIPGWCGLAANAENLRSERASRSSRSNSQHENKAANFRATRDHDLGRTVRDPGLVWSRRECGESQIGESFTELTFK